jgi:muramidase (phage lysozyme)
MRSAYLASAGMILGAAYVLYAKRDGVDLSVDFGGVSDYAQSALDTVTDIGGQIMAYLRLGNMRNVTQADLQHRNVKAILQVIRAGEGTNKDGGYKTLFGGGKFESYADHPRIKVTRMVGGKSLTSTAAGAYQFLATTWDETASAMGLRDFSPVSQDLAAVGRIAARGALDDVKAGRIGTALKKISYEWASMPGSPYGQPTIALDKASRLYADAGGLTNG